MSAADARRKTQADSSQAARETCIRAAEKSHEAKGKEVGTVYAMLAGSRKENFAGKLLDNVKSFVSIWKKE